MAQHSMSSSPSYMSPVAPSYTSHHHHVTTSPNLYQPPSSSSPSISAPLVPENAIPAPVSAASFTFAQPLYAPPAHPPSSSAQGHASTSPLNTLNPQSLPFKEATYISPPAPSRTGIESEAPDGLQLLINAATLQDTSSQLSAQPLGVSTIHNVRQSQRPTRAPKASIIESDEEDLPAKKLRNAPRSARGRGKGIRGGKRQVN